MNIFVAKLNFKTTSEDLLALFEQFGEVTSAKVIIDKVTNRSKGFGFVDMPDVYQSYAAFNELNESVVDGRPIVVKKSRPKEEGESRPRSGGSGGGGGYRNRY